MRLFLLISIAIGFGFATAPELESGELERYVLKTHLNQAVKIHELMKKSRTILRPNSTSGISESQFTERHQHVLRELDSGRIPAQVDLTYHLSLLRACDAELTSIRSLLAEFPESSAFGKASNQISWGGEVVLCKGDPFSFGMTFEAILLDACCKFHEKEFISAWQCIQAAWLANDTCLRCWVDSDILRLCRKRQERLLVVATAIFPYLDHDSAELRLQTMPIAMGPVPLEQLCLAYVKSDFVDRPDAVRHDAGRAAYQAVFKTAPFDDRQMIVHYYSLTEVGDDGVQFRGHDRAPPVLLLELLIDDRRRINVGRLLFAVAFELGSENDFEIARRKLKTSLERSESQGMSGLTGTLAEGVGDHVGLRRLDLILADTVRPLIGLKGSVQNLSLSF